MTQYSFNFDTAQAGQIADMTYSTIDSFIAEDRIQYGVPLIRGTDPQRQVLPYEGVVETAPNGILGISVFSQIEGPVLDPDTQVYTYSYLINKNVSVMVQGRIYINVKTGINITAGDNAYIETGTGLFTNEVQNESNVDNLQINGSFYTTGVGGSDLIILELR
jgi:hypothetical protein